MSKIEGQNSFPGMEKPLSQVEEDTLEHAKRTIAAKRRWKHPATKTTPGHTVTENEKIEHQRYAISRGAMVTTHKDGKRGVLQESIHAIKSPYTTNGKVLLSSEDQFHTFYDGHREYYPPGTLFRSNTSRKIQPSKS